jgi:small-conductance mechanosensitive channel
MRTRTALVLLSWFLLVGGSLPAAQAQPPAQLVQPATLVFQNREIVVLRAVVLGYAPEQRAAAAAERLRRIAEEPQGNEEVTARPISEGLLVEVGGRAVFVIAPGDVNTLVGETAPSIGERVIADLTLALSASREQRDLVSMARAAGAALAATAMFLLLVWGLVRGGAWVGNRLQSLSVNLVSYLRVGGHVAVSPSGIGRGVKQAVVLTGWLIGLFLAYLWLTFLLARFPYTRPWGEQLRDFLLEVLGTVARAIAQAIPGLVFVVVIGLLARLLTRMVTAFMERVETGRIKLSWLDADTAQPTRRILNAALWLFALAMAYPYLPGSQSEAFKGLSVLVGLMVTIGASGIVGQAASGLILVYSRALRRGEYVRIGETEGTVAEVGLFATRVRTGLGEEVVLPNAVIVSNTTKNYSRAVAGGSGFVLNTTLTIGYSTPWRQVQAMLLEAARRTPGILAEPTPFVVQTALSDFYVEYRLVAYAGPELPAKRARVLDALHANIQDVFNEYGVQIMSPHYMMDTPQPQVVPKEKWHDPPAVPAQRPDTGPVTG